MVDLANRRLVNVATFASVDLQRTQASIPRLSTIARQDDAYTGHLSQADDADVSGRRREARRSAPHHHHGTPGARSGTASPT